MQASVIRQLKGKRLQLALLLTLLYFIFGLTLAAFVPRKAGKRQAERTATFHQAEMKHVN